MYSNSPYSNPTNSVLPATHYPHRQSPDPNLPCINTLWIKELLLPNDQFARNYVYNHSPSTNDCLSINLFLYVHTPRQQYYEEIARHVHPSLTSGELPGSEPDPPHCKAFHTYSPSSDNTTTAIRKPLPANFPSRIPPRSYHPNNPTRYYIREFYYTAIPRKQHRNLLLPH